MCDIDQYMDDARMFAQHIVVALDCLSQVQAMDQIFGQKKHQVDYRKAPHFYRTAYHAMLYRFQMEVIKLFDKDGDSYTFPEFKNILYKNGLLTHQMGDDYEMCHKIAKKDIGAIRTRRNKDLAHPDKEWFNRPEQLYNENPLNFDRIDKLLQVMLLICDKILLQNSEYGPAQLYSTYNGDDFVKLFGYETRDEKETREFWNV